MNKAAYFCWMEIGICTFADVGTHPITKEIIDPHQRLHNLIEEIQLADELGLNVFAIGEHHRPDYAVSTPATVMAAAAVKTKTIKLSSGVTVLSSDDPVRVFQQFATVDLLSNGRAEIMAGRGSFIESFPLFGYNLNDYDELFSEKLEMLMKLNESEKVSWKGKLTQTIDNLGIYPRPYQKRIPIWVAVGGTPESVVRSAQFGLPMMLAIIGGMPARFAPFVRLYRDMYARTEHSQERLQIGINSHTYIAETSQCARDEFYPPYSEVMTRIGKERGWSGMSRADFDAATEPQAHLLVGSPQQVIDKILYQHSIFNHTRFLAQMSIGAMPHHQVMKAIELLGNIVAPAVRKHTKEQFIQ
jgi:probable LLM family oxidoreductase